MKTVYIPKGETVRYESLTTEHLVVHGCLEVAGGIKARTIAGSGTVRAGAVNADVIRVDDVEAGSIVCKRLLAKRDRRVTQDGVLVLSAQRFRTQERNREDARSRLAAFVEAGLHAPKPRIATRPSRGAKERRLGEKRERAGIKRGRAGRDWE